MNAAEKPKDLMTDPARRDGLIVTNQISVCKDLNQTTTNIIYDFCRVGSPYSDKL